MSPFVTQISKKDQWVWPISGVCVVLGFMLAMAWVTPSTRRSRIGLLDASQRQRVSAEAVDVEAYEDMSAQLDTLRKQNTDLQNSIGKNKEGAGVLNKQLQETKAAAGLTEVEGPGVVVTIRDAAGMPSAQNLPDQIRDMQNIHDLDVIRVVNDLIASGAEAISINEHRVSGLTSIRCVGPTILINDVKIASPVVIKAIGDANTMLGGLNINGGVLSEIRDMDPKMVGVETVKQMRLPAFSGRTEFRLGKVPKEDEKREGEKPS